VTVLAALAVGGVSGSKNGLAPPLGVGGSGVRNGVGLEPDEASARAELAAVGSSCPVALVSASALRFRSAEGATVGAAF
jgi:ABC-type phosphate transport system substrate-binding protein